MRNVIPNRNVVITETELELIHNVVKDWLHADTHYHIGNQDYRDEVIALQNSLPPLDKDMPEPLGCEYCGESDCNCAEQRGED